MANETGDIKNFYNQAIPGKYSNNYEYARWFSSDIQKAGYDMTKAAVKKCAAARQFNECLELGPGHGTWTQLLVDTHPYAKFDLVDISAEMLRLSRDRFAGQSGIDFHESDFLVWKTGKKYDFIFSSRALEYMPDKEKVVEKIVGLLKEGGYGFIITKTPKYIRAKMLRRTIPAMHRKQISPHRLVYLLEKFGCQNVRVWPVTVSLPFLNSPSASLWLHRRLAGRRLNFFSQLFCESYGVEFRK